MFIYEMKDFFLFGCTFGGTATGRFPKAVMFREARLTLWLADLKK